MSARERLDQIDAEFLVMRPACDGGLPAGCACSPRDPRSTMNDLVAAHRAVLAEHQQCTADDCPTVAAIESALGGAR